MSDRSRRDFVRSVAGVPLLSWAERPACAKDSIALIGPGKRNASIFLSPAASPSEKYAAGELGAHLERMTGVRLPIVIGEKIPDSPVISLGRNAVTEKYGFEIPQGEACLLRSEGDALMVAGGPTRGTMYGVFCFLEKFGCRWFTTDVARIPRAPAISIAALNEIARPAFEYREVFFTEAQGTEWSARNRLNGHFHRLDESVGGKISYMPFAHSSYDLIPPARYFGTHPEYFALVAGKRRDKNSQLCLTNADIVDIATKQVQKWLTNDPTVSIVSVSQNDGSGWCECGPCQQAVREEGGAVSGVLLRFVNQIAQRVGQSHPSKIVDTLAYQKSAVPPAIVKPLPNVQIRFCPIDACQAHSYETCHYNRNFREQLSGWARIAPRLVLWEYSINFAHFLLPFPNEHALISDFPRFQHAGVTGVFVEGAVSDGGGGENAELRAYLAARLLWNPQSDIAEETRGFLNAVYGPASPLMAQYFALRHGEIRPDEHLWIDQNLDAPYLTDRFLKDARDLLNRAYAKVASAAPRRRIERCSLPLDYVSTMRGRRCRVIGMSYGPEDVDRVKFQTTNFVDKAKSLGITHLREGYPLSAQAGAFDELAKAYSVVSLDDGALSVKIVPELGARMIFLGPAVGTAGSNVLRVPDPGEFSYPHAGGLYFNVFSSYVSNAQRVIWQAGTPSNGSVLLTGVSDQGLDLEMVVRLEAGVLRVRFTAGNHGLVSLPTALRCQSEFALRSAQNALLHYTTRSGTERNHRVERGAFPVDQNQTLQGDECADGKWTLAIPERKRKIRNRFDAEGIRECGIRWSFRSSPRLILSLLSSEVLLIPGHELTIESQYELA